MPSGGSSLQLNPSVAMRLTGTGHNIAIGASTHTITGDSRVSINFAANTWTSWSAATFGFHGSTQELVFLDELSDTLYRVTLIVGSSYNNNMISIERL